jgi:hypothetical protein
MATSVENADSQTYIVANGIKTSTAKIDVSQGRLFQLISRCTKFLFEEQ